MKNYQKGSIVLQAVLILIVLVAGIGYFIYKGPSFEREKDVVNTEIVSQN